ncbi:MAG: glycoside hydrolase family 5 protein, partial [Pseudomonadota bacterium]
TDPAHGEPSRQFADSQSSGTSPISACINLGGALEAPREGDWGYTVRERDLHRIAQAGFDTIRLPVAWSQHTMRTSPYLIDRRLLARTDAIISAALDAGLNVILDVHHYFQLMKQPDAHEARLDAIWRQLSDHYEGWPDGLIFEFLNEPHSRMNTTRVDAMNARLLRMVRARHPDRWVIMGGAGWGKLDGLLQARIPFDERAITTFHYYDPFEFTHQGADFDKNAPPKGQKWGTEVHRQRLENTMSRARAFRDRVGMPVFLGEFGVYGEVPLVDRAKWTRAVREAAEASGIGWCYFDWGTSFRLYDLERERWLMSMRHALLP